jgi:hypothetical protein
MLEAIKLVGAIVGFATGVFTVWDRWARGRPLAWVTATKLGANPYKYIRIKNPGPADVFILAVRAYPSKVYSIAKDHSTEAIVGAASFNVDVNVVLWQGEERDLPIIDVSKPDQRNTADRPVRFVIYWRKTSSSWLRQVPVVVWTSTRDVERIANAATAVFNQYPVR